MINGTINVIAAITNRTADIGLVKKIVQLSPEINRDWFKLDSASGPKINASTIGATGNPYLLIKNANSPKASIIQTSKKLLLMAYEPTILKIKMIGPKITGLMTRTFENTLAPSRPKTMTKIFAINILKNNG